MRLWLTATLTHVVDKGQDPAPKTSKLGTNDQKPLEKCRNDVMVVRPISDAFDR